MVAAQHTGAPSLLDIPGANSGLLPPKAPVAPVTPALGEECDEVLTSSDRLSVESADLTPDREFAVPTTSTSLKRSSLKSATESSERVVDKSDLGGNVDRDEHKHTHEHELEHEHRRHRHGILEFVLTSSLSLFGQLVFVYGLWTLMDAFIIYSATATFKSTPGSWLTYQSTELNLIALAVSE